MKLVVTNVPYFRGECPFNGYGAEDCSLTCSRCNHFDLPCDSDECDGLISFEKMLKECGENA